jgi:hypothetical protein
MNLEPSQHVKCIFRNGTIVEGIIETWTKEEAILISLDGESKLIILRPTEDLIMIKLMLDAPVKEETKFEFPKTELEQKFNEILDKPTDTPGRLETLAELRVQLIEAEKQVVANELKNWNINSPYGVHYASPMSTLVKHKRPRDKMTGNPISAYDLSAIKRNWKGKI